jgi:predicted patatin/cPLA2 family phospholipase
MERDIIVIIEGGGMTVGFGSGVVESLQKQHIYSRIHSVYGSSAGAHDAAYFLSKQTDMGGQVPIEYLSSNQFIKKEKLKKFIKAVVSGKRYNLMHIEYLINVEKHIKRLDVHTIKHSPIGLFFRVFNVNKLQSDIIDGKDHIFEGLTASSACIPYFNTRVKIHGEICVDGSKMITKSFEDTIKENRDKKIIYIVNHKQNLGDVISGYWLQFLESFLIWRLYGFKLALKYATAFDVIDLKKLKKHKNVILVVNNLNNDIMCTDKEKLTELFEYGKKQGQKAIQYL